VTGAMVNSCSTPLLLVQLETINGFLIADSRRHLGRETLPCNG
jgi:hypothetical protein